MWFRMISNGSLSEGLVSRGAPIWAGHLAAILFASAVVALAIRFRRERLYADPTLWLTLGLVVLPISWISYDIVLLPALVNSLSPSRSSRRAVSLAVWAIWIGISAAFAYQLLDDRLVATGDLTLVARLLVILGWGIGATAWDWRTSRLATLVAGGAGDLPGKRSLLPTASADA